MNEQEVLERLKKLIISYKDKLNISNDPYSVYISLAQFNEVYRKITGNNYLDLDIYKLGNFKLFSQINDKKESNLFNDAFNCYDFYDYCKSKLPKILMNSIDLLESVSKPSGEFTDIKKSEIRPLVNDFFKYIKLENKDLINRFYDNNYIIDLDDTFDGFSGVTYFDLVGNNDYICVSTKDRGNLEVASTHVHEAGHVDDVSNLDLKTKKDYVMSSPYLEIPSHMIQNEFLDFLSNENISKEFSRRSKYEMIEDGIYDLFLCFSFFDSFVKNETIKDIDIFKNIKYGFGKFIGFSILNDKESFDIYKDNHYNIFNSKLLEKMDMNEDKCIKILSKEIDKIYK